MRGLRRLFGTRARAEPPVDTNVQRATLTLDELRISLGYDIAQMISSGCDPAIVADHVAFNADLERFLENPTLGHYLRSTTPEVSYETSGVIVLSISDLAREIRTLTPGWRLVTLGFFPFARSESGNLICFARATGQVVWASHESFDDTFTTSPLPIVADDFRELVVALDAGSVAGRLSAFERGQ